MNCLENGFHEAGVVYGLTCTSKIKMRTSSIIERLNEEIRRNERVISIYPNEESIECKSQLNNVDFRQSQNAV